MPVQARYTDLVLVGTERSYQDPLLRRRIIKTMVFGSGRPIMLLPEGARPKQLDHMVLGWNATREANRVLHDVLP
jgi:hypothetical protein